MAPAHLALVPIALPLLLLLLLTDPCAGIHKFEMRPSDADAGRSSAVELWDKGSLEGCQGALVADLKLQCSSMSEEELGKVCGECGTSVSAVVVRIEGLHG
jgi:hypothetical protein